MIFVKRCATPEVFKKKRKLIEKEIKKAKFFFNSDNADKTTDGLFKFYSGQKKGYKEELVRMFRQRCAYCECLVTIGSRGDIEHFRPKGEFIRFDGTPGRPGYYWLAADWNNLYLSCTNCNQKSTLRIIDPKDPTKLIEKTIGKMNQFALKNEDFRLKDETGTLDLEEPYRLLIDPCKDNPADFLEFTPEGIVKAKEKDEKTIDMASYSINVYGLLREELVSIRAKKFMDIKDRIVTIERVTPFVVDGIKAQSTTPQHRFNCEEMEKNFLKLMDMLDADNIHSEYIGLARQHADPFINTHTQVLKDVLNPQVNQQEPWFQQALTYFHPQMAALKAYFEKKY